jgi:hypothetical protein
VPTIAKGPVCQPLFADLEKERLPVAKIIMMIPTINEIDKNLG